ncbi:hypothetical protein CLV63_13010 [Murinocardiopsis flavida]|uniref:DUF2178 domain-containing protein n=1 Tax=Murinocardiopsis flavida TaxID=645275 RepID=A0A2P8CSV7_9ACTN|nr:hypothetical protein [Murinocardiopsis flavida]PSK88048.1 hypothetical protein CLV63_13010 [Murinocardiopsis flavida]
MLMTKRLWLVAATLVLVGVAFSTFAFMVSANWIFPTILVAVFCYSLWTMFRTHLRPDEASDGARLGSGKLLDERDRSMQQNTFAIVGYVAVPLGILSSYSIILFDTLDPKNVVHAQFVILLITWTAAGTYVTRKK